MKQGKLPENVLKRSVLRQLHTGREDVLTEPGIGADCAAIRLAEGETAVFSADPVIWTDRADAKRVVHAVCNDLACAGAEPVGLLLTALLPADPEEADLREMVQCIDAECAALGVEILGGHTEVTDAVNCPVISIAGIGKVSEDRRIVSGGARPDDDIVVTKWIALEGTSRLARLKRTKLLERFPAYLVEEAAGFDCFLSVLPEARAVRGVSAMHDISEGGIFGALWEFAESAGVGLEIDLKKIPIRQETVEICNFFDINPYQLVAGGSLLIAARDGNSLVRCLEAKGIHAAVIGKAVSGNDRVILNAGERRFLERPGQDEIRRMMIPR
ncbi:MAG: AIR synthase family protein [Clostridiales bacterium]|nr:AIR synthase family protein [Clostridiales bacterium]